MPDEHALFSPSGSERWLNCPGSIGMARLIEEEPESSYAAEEGTAAHWLFEDWKNRKDAKQAPNGIPITNDMRRYIYNSLLEVKSKIGDPFFIEKEMKLQIWKELGLKKEVIWGTADLVSVDRNNACLIDLKYGKYSISPKNNPQLMTYAVGLLDLMDKYGKTDLNLVICQPRTGAFWKPHLVSIYDIIQWKTKLKNYFKSRKEIKFRSRLDPGDHCFFCVAKQRCSAHSGFITHAS